MNKTLRELFLERVIRNDAVQRERAAAVEDVRRKRIEATEEDVKRFFDFGIRFGSSLWPIKKGAIERKRNRKPALYRAFDAADGGWHQIVRDLRHRKLIAIGHRLSGATSLARLRFRSGMTTVDPDRREIGPETWLSEGLLFDVRDNAICTRKTQSVSPVFGGCVSREETRVHKLWNEITVREASAESATETHQPSQAEPTEAGSESTTETGQPNQVEPAGANSTTPPHPEKNDEKLPSLREQMVIDMLLTNGFSDGLSLDDIPGKVKVVVDHWKAQCAAPLGDVRRRVEYREPGPTVVRRAIEKYLKHPERFPKQR